MSFARRDLLALLLVAGAAVASAVVWDYGRVDIGLTLTSNDRIVTVFDVTPDGNAARNFISPSSRVIDLSTADGGKVERAEPTRAEDGGVYAPPLEAVDSARIDEIVVGDVDPESGVSYVFGGLDRGYLEFLLQQSAWLALLGIGLGAVAWRLLVNGVAGTLGSEHAVLLGAAVAAPFVMLPVIQVGTPIGIAAGFLLPGALALLLGLSLARQHPDRQWVQTASAGALVAAGMAAIIVVRYMTSPALYTNDRGQIFMLVAAVALVPAAIAAMAPGRSTQQRAGIVSLSLVPAAAMTLIAPSSPEPVLPIFLVAGLLGWQLLPVDALSARVAGGMRHLRSAQQGQTAPAWAGRAVTRDMLTLGMLVAVGLASIVQQFSAAAVLGAGLAAIVGLAVRRGFLGAEWTDAAVPLAASVGIPVMLLSFSWSFTDYAPMAAPTALAALAVSAVLAARHTDPVLRTRLFLASAGLSAFIIVVVALGNVWLAIPLVGLVALIPGVPVAFAEDVGEPRAVSQRLETLVVALTPGAAATVLVAGTNGLLLGAWLVMLVIWRRFTLAPLLGIAERSQLQRDVAVAAAETERARLAADLHDDALQQLTMLVRTLDESGQAEAAAQARDVATKLRSIVGDLRLPILDDLGAGAALEWLVERFEPLAGGPVKLERSDASRPPANVELAVFRVAQEALTNAIKHGSTPIAVRYDVNANGRVTLAIDDAGAGIGENAAEEAPREGHFGLLNMQQRAEQIGALLDVRRWPAGGTRVALEWRPQ